MRASATASPVIDIHKILLICEAIGGSLFKRIGIVPRSPMEKNDAWILRLAKSLGINSVSIGYRQKEGMAKHRSDMQNNLMVLEIKECHQN